MAQVQWQFDAPTGTFKSHTMSRHIYDEAVNDSVFMDHVKPVDGFGKKKGETVTLTRVADIAEPTSGLLVEGERIPEDTYAITTKAITVLEFGRAVPFTSLSEDLTWFDLENSIQSRLRDQMRLTLDSRAARAFRQAQLKYAITGLASRNLATNGTFGAASTENLNVFHLETIRDDLYDTNRVPMIDGNYIGIFRTLGLRGVKRDPAWEEWHKYTDPQAKFNSEVGRMEQIRLIETNHGGTGSVASTGGALGIVGTGSVLGEGVVFGQDAVAMAEAQSPELRAAIPDDFGRSKAVAWYGILEFDIIWDTGTAGQARIIHVGST
jgi:N4-gp56 family major capsid protein